jgi:hypothetical protein
MQLLDHPTPHTGGGSHGGSSSSLASVTQADSSAGHVDSGIHNDSSGPITSGPTLAGALRTLTEGGPPLELAQTCPPTPSWRHSSGFTNEAPERRVPLLHGLSSTREPLG